MEAIYSTLTNLSQKTGCNKMYLKMEIFENLMLISSVVWESTWAKHPPSKRERPQVKPRMGHLKKW